MALPGVLAVAAAAGLVRVPLKLVLVEPALRVGIELARPRVAVHGLADDGQALAPALQRVAQRPVRVGSVEPIASAAGSSGGAAAPPPGG